MALSEHQIIFNYNQAMAKAQELDTAAAKLESDAVNEMDSIISSINRNWTGDNAQAYIQKCTKEQSNISAIAQSIRTTASTIRTMAENIKRAEMEALRIAREQAAAAERARQEQLRQQQLDALQRR